MNLKSLTFRDIAKPIVFQQRVDSSLLFNSGDGSDKFRVSMYRSLIIIILLFHTEILCWKIFHNFQIILRFRMKLMFVD